MDDFNFEGYTCPVPIRPTDTVILGHGSGGTFEPRSAQPALSARTGESRPAPWMIQLL